MPDAALTLGCVDFLDRTRPILERQVEVPGLKLAPARLKPMELLNRFSEFDICEIPLFASFMLGQGEYVALPVFPHRGYPHGSVVVHERSGIKQPRDLAGRRIATPGLFLSGTVWMRGILGEDSERIRWLIPAYPKESLAFRLTEEIVSRSGIEVEATAGNLSDMLEKGELDGWIGPLPPECFERGAPGVRRLFPDYAELERAYARKTRFVPALHAVIMRRRLQAQAKPVIELFHRARQAGLRNFQNDNVFAVMLPWMRQHLEELKEIFGADWVPSGFDANRDMIAAGLDYAARQGLTKGRRSAEELFAW